MVKAEHKGTRLTAAPGGSSMFVSEWHMPKEMTGLQVAQNWSDNGAFLREVQYVHRQKCLYRGLDRKSVV